MQENNVTSLKFLEAEIENFKNITSKVVQMDGRSLIIFGGNGKSKSSFIEALLSPLCADVVPPEPIRKGEEKSTVKIKIGGEFAGKPVEYHISMFFTPGNKKGRLLVERPDGEVVNKPATVLKNVVGDISFDIFDFLRQKPDKQAQVLKQLSGKAVEIDTITMDYQRTYEERTNINRRVSELDGIVKNHAYTDEEIDKYNEVIPVEPIREEMNTVGKSLQAYIGVENKLADFNKKVIEINSEVEQERQAIQSYIKLIAQKKANIGQLTLEKEEFNTKIVKGGEWLKVTKKPETEEIMSRLTKANEHNRHVEKVKELSDKHHELIKLKNEALAKTEELEKKNKQKTEVIKNSSLPIQGLTFTDNEVFYEGLPLDTTQINTAKLIEIGREISMALNPNLRVIFIKDGSLLDKHSLKTLLDSAQAKGYQVIVELVDFEGGNAEIEFVEDFLSKQSTAKQVIDTTKSF